MVLPLFVTYVNDTMTKEITPNIEEGNWYRFHYPHTMPGFFGGSDDTEYCGGQAVEVSDSEIVLKDAQGWTFTIDLTGPATHKDNEIVHVEEWDRKYDAWHNSEDSPRIVWESE